MQPQMRGVWGVAQLFVALGAGGWAYFQTRTPDGIPLEVFWPVCTAVGALFFLVAAILFFSGHPDGRVVGLFGLLFVIASGGIQAILSIDACTTDALDDKGVPICNPIGQAYIWSLLVVVGIFTVVELLLLYGAGRKPPVEPEPDLPL